LKNKEKRRKMNQINYEIKEHIGIISENKNGWTKELNLVSWNDNDPKYDIREWDPKHEKMSRGITLTEEEAYELSIILSGEFEG
jgi:hypothetical protein